MKTRLSYALLSILAGAIFLVGLTYSITKSCVEQHYSIVCSTEQLTNLVENIKPNQVFIDLRSREDYENGHIDGFINIPSKEGTEVLEYLLSHGISQKHIYLFCYSGKRAALTFELLRNNGFRNLTYISIGYETYQAEAEGFEPQTGPCDCLSE